MGLFQFLSVIGNELLGESSSNRDSWRPELYYVLYALMSVQ